jgi:GT2 family glycosyltransferase
MGVNSTSEPDSESAVLQEVISTRRVDPLGKVSNLRAYLDVATHSIDGGLIVVGWIYDPKKRVKGLATLTRSGSLLHERGYRALALENGVDGVAHRRVSRPDVAQAMSAPSDMDDRHGFVLVVRRWVPDSILAMVLDDDRYLVLPMEQVKALADAEPDIQNCVVHSGKALFLALRSSLGRGHAASRRISRLLGRQEVSTSVDVVGSIEHVYPLGAEGVLVFGWMYSPLGRPRSITVHDQYGRQVEVGDRMIPLAREDAAEAYRSRYSKIHSRIGFFCCVPMPTEEGDPRDMCVDFGEHGEVWFKVPTDRPVPKGIDEVREILSLIRNPGEIQHDLWRLFDAGLGKALESLIGPGQSYEGEVRSRQFGVPPEAPAISMIVPLYGRYDFLRHQLAQFADDPDFQQVDLIYVIDDPGIVSQTLDLAARYQWLFGVPFRVLWYDENRGFAGANNIGTRFATGEYLALVNSDVIPKHPGWLKRLQEALENLPAAGAVGPLLLFADDTVQHAGMYPRTDTRLPGFLLNSHKGMGMTWEGPEHPSEHPMLTAACLMVRREEYEMLGGLDEGYAVGDFEDSDFCLALRTRGKRLYLVPGARLWHLERQSQTLGQVAGVRQLITLFNGWRFHQKIKHGEIADPTAWQAAVEGRA